MYILTINQPKDADLKHLPGMITSYEHCGLYQLMWFKAEWNGSVQRPAVAGPIFPLPISLSRATRWRSLRRAPVLGGVLALANAGLLSLHEPTDICAMTNIEEDSQ